MPFEEGGLHPSLQGRKVYVAVGPFGSDPRGRGILEVAFLGAISEREMKSRSFREGKIQEDGDNGG